MQTHQPQLISQLIQFEPELIIFDKDGTLINFHTMWGQWIEEVARKLELATGLTLAADLFRAMDYEPNTGHIIPGGELADAPLAELRALTYRLLGDMGLTAEATEAAMTNAWHPPDPLAEAQPLADLPALFTLLCNHGLKIAIATSDDHAPTEALINHWHLSEFIDVIICADDGLPIKPAPDMILHICRILNIAPAKAAMIGDNVADLKMGHAAGVGLTVGVLSGISQVAHLAAEADLILTSINDLIQN